MPILSMQPNLLRELGYILHDSMGKLDFRIRSDIKWDNTFREDDMPKKGPAQEKINELNEAYRECEELRTYVMRLQTDVEIEIDNGRSSELEYIHRRLTGILKKMKRYIIPQKLNPSNKESELTVREFVKNEFRRLEADFEFAAAQEGGEWFDESGPLGVRCSTGFNDLDRATGGLHDTDIILVAGRPFMGKTDFVTRIGLHFASKNKKPVLFFSLRLAPEIIIRRMIAAQSEISLHRYSRGVLTEGDWPKLVSSAEFLVDISFLLEGGREFTDNELLEKIRRTKEKNGLGLVIIDGVENISSQTKYGSRNTEVFELIKNIKRLAAYQIPIILTVCTSRDNEFRLDKRPIFADLNEWEPLGSEVANTVMFLYRDAIYNSSTPEKYVAEVILAKNSYGNTGTIRVFYNSERCRYDNLYPESIIPP